MLKKLSGLLPIVFLFNILAVSLAISPAHAAGASLFLTPASGDYKVGKTFTAKVSVNSGGGVGINAAEGSISFDPALLLVSKVTKDNSIFSLWTAEPTFSNKNGTISFGGGSPSSFSGSAGTIMNIVFVARQEGTATVSFSSGIVLAADGQGTNVYSGARSSSYNITADAAPKEEEKKPEDIKKPDTTSSKGPLPPMPDLSSNSHPDETKWYPSNSVEMNWHILGDLTGVSLSMTDDPASDPGANSMGVLDTRTFDNVPDGVHYVHGKFKNQYGWGQIAHRKIMIDSVSPAAFDILVDNGGDNTNPKPIIDFSTTDNTSGLSHYSVSIDGQTEDVQPRNFKADPYTTKLLAPGTHNLTVIAVDRANNRATSTKSFGVEALKLPVIGDYPKIVNKGDTFMVRGTSFYPDATVTMYFGKDGKELEAITIHTDAEGNWSYLRKKGLDKGNYDIWAKIADKRGAESGLTEKEGITVINPSVIQAYGWWIIVLLIAIIIGLVLYILYQRRKHKEEEARIQREIDETKNKMGEVFNALKEEVDELIEFADKKPGLSESEKRVKDKLREALDISEEFISKEVSDIEKEIK